MQTAELRQALHATDLETEIAAIRAACSDKRAEVLPDLLALLATDVAGYFVEECLPEFGPAVVQPLRDLLHDPETPNAARRRAAGVLALFGDREAAPILLEAIGDPAVNQAYLGRLVELAPGRLAERARELLRGRVKEALSTTDPGLATYFAQLVRILGEPAVPRDPQDDALLTRLATKGRDWRVREAAALVLVVILVRRFRGQTVPGELLNVAGPFRLPAVERVWAPVPFPARDSQPDVLVEGDTGRWVVEVKAGRELGSDTLEQVAAYRQTFSATVWLIVFASIPDGLKTLARQRQILLTGAAELSALSQLLAA